MDAVSFKQQFLPYHKKLYRIAFRLMGNAQDAEDMMQEAYLKLWEKREIKVKKHIQIIRLRWIGSVAASLLILLSVGMYMYKPHTTPDPQDICETSKEAYAEAQKALLMFSSALNKGMEQVETVQEMTGKMQENVNKLLN